MTKLLLSRTANPYTTWVQIVGSMSSGLYLPIPGLYQAQLVKSGNIHFAYVRKLMN